jgi:hypothetical protein
MPTPAETAAAQINAVLDGLTIQDRFRVLNRVIEASNQMSSRYEQEEFHARRERILAAKRARTYVET